jgi:aspartate oxidase
LLEGLVFGARAAAMMKGASPPAVDILRGSPAGDSVTTDTVAAPVAAVSAVVASSGASSAVSAEFLPVAVDGNIPSANQVRDLMWRRVGILRDGHSLEHAVEQLHAWAGALQVVQTSGNDQAERRRIGSIITTGLLMARAARCRTESRGTHFREDFPSRDDLHWNTRITDRLHVD